VASRHGTAGGRREPVCRPPSTSRPCRRSPTSARSAPSAAVGVRSACTTTAGATSLKAASTSIGSAPAGTNGSNGAPRTQPRRWISKRRARRSRASRPRHHVQRHRTLCQRQTRFAGSAAHRISAPNSVARVHHARMASGGCWDHHRTSASTRGSPSTRSNAAAASARMPNPAMSAGKGNRRRRPGRSPPARAGFPPRRRAACPAASGAPRRRAAPGRAHRGC